VTSFVAPGEAASLEDWLRWIEATHPSEIELGLKRAAMVASRVKLLPVHIPVITVAGTNGKGSTVAMLESVYRAAGFSTGVYTSPHIMHFNERISVDGAPASDMQLVSAFEAIESARGDIALTYFEFSTLAAVYTFIHSDCDVILLEVGLGGRLDTTNVWDTDCAIVTSIAIDHESWLGSDREAIGHEKIGIGRPGIPLIMGDPNPPPGVLQEALEAGMDLQRVPPASAREFLALSLPGAHQQSNAHAALMAVAAMNDRLPVALSASIAALASVQLAGRFEQQRINGVQTVLDVAHNPAAAASVLAGFDERFPQSPVFAVFGALNDKDVVGVVNELSTVVQHWHCVNLEVERGTPAAELCSAVMSVGGRASEHQTMAEAFEAAYQRASAYNSSHPIHEAVVLVAGSFFTLTAFREHWQDVSRL